eukprot:scaffold108268_cov36-Phaeocystis_antarctica.AAC.1
MARAPRARTSARPPSSTSQRATPTATYPATAARCFAPDPDPTRTRLDPDPDPAMAPALAPALALALVNPRPNPDTCLGPTQFFDVKVKCPTYYSLLTTYYLLLTTYYLLLTTYYLLLATYYLLWPVLRRQGRGPRAAGPQLQAAGDGGGGGARTGQLALRDPHTVPASGAPCVPCRALWHHRSAPRAMTTVTARTPSRRRWPSGANTRSTY